MGADSKIEWKEFDGKFLLENDHFILEVEEFSVGWMARVLVKHRCHWATDESMYHDAAMMVQHRFDSKEEAMQEAINSLEEMLDMGMGWLETIREGSKCDVTTR